MTPRELIAAFETLADAPDGVKRLRELVLQLAVRGKLVPQVPTDEPASELLKRVEREQERLRAAGLLGREKLPPEIDPERLYKLPLGWAWCRLGQLTKFVTSGSRGWAEYYSEDGPMFLRIGNLDYGTRHLDLSNIQRVNPPQNAEGTRTKTEKHDVLVSITGDTGMIGVVPPGIEAYINQHIALCRLVLPESSDYLATVLISPHGLEELQSRERGIKNSLGLEDVRAAAIPIPPLAEQHRIVARVDELMGLLDRLEAACTTREEIRRAARDAALAALRDCETEAVDVVWTRISCQMDVIFNVPEDVAPLRQIILQLAVRGRLLPHEFGGETGGDFIERCMALRNGEGKRATRLPPVSAPDDLFALPPGWVWLRLDDICSVVGGVAKGRDLAGRQVESVPYLRVANVQAGYLDLEVIKEIEIPEDEVSQHRLRPGDILLTEGGDWDKLGRSAIWNGEIELCIHQNHVFRARPLSPGILSRWISMFTNSPDGRAYFQSCSKQTTNLASINMTQLRNCLVPLPSESEQHRIVAKVDALMALCDQLEARLTAARELQAQFAAAAVHHLDV